MLWDENTSCRIRLYCTHALTPHLETHSIHSVEYTLCSWQQGYGILGGRLYCHLWDHTWNALGHRLSLDRYCCSQVQRNWLHMSPGMITPEMLEWDSHCTPWLVTVELRLQCSQHWCRPHLSGPPVVWGSQVPVHPGPPIDHREPVCPPEWIPTMRTSNEIGLYLNISKF